MRVAIPEELETARLRLRMPHREDAAAAVEAIEESFAELHRWMEWASQVPGIEQEREILERRAGLHRSGSDLSFLMWRRSDARLVGVCGVPRLDWERRTFEIGYWVRTSLVGHGYVGESVERVARFAFEELAARRLEIRASTRNLRSILVAERAGFRREHTRVADARHPDGSPRDTLVLARYPASGAPSRDSGAER